MAAAAIPSTLTRQSIQPDKCIICLTYPKDPVSHRTANGVKHVFDLECLLRYHLSPTGSKLRVGLPPRRVYYCPTCKAEIPRADQLPQDTEALDQTETYVSQEAYSKEDTEGKPFFLLREEALESYKAYQDFLKAKYQSSIDMYMKQNAAFPNGNIAGAIGLIEQIENSSKKIQLSKYLVEVCKKQKNLEALKRIFLAGCAGNIEWINASNAFYAIIDNNIYDFEHDKVAFLKSILNDLNKLPAGQGVVLLKNRLILTLINVMIDDPTGSLSALRFFYVLENQLQVLAGLVTVR